MEALTKYFPHLSERQQAQFLTMEELYREWNARINVISRKDMDNLLTHHILHSLAIAKVVSFTLCDSIGKKVKVAQTVTVVLELSNVRCVQARAESLPGCFDYVVSRAVTDLSTFYPWVKGKYSKAICYLKGGDLDAEIADCIRRCRLDPGKFYVAPISNWFDDPWFEEKKIVIISQ